MSNETISPVKAHDSNVPPADVTLPDLVPPSPGALRPPAIFGAIKGAIIGGPAGALFVLLTRPIVAIFLAILGSTTPQGEIGRVGDVSVRFKTMGDFPFPDVEIVIGIAGVLVGLIFGATKAYQKKYLSAILEPFTNAGAEKRALALVACVLSPKRFVRVHGVAQLKEMGASATCAIPSMLSLLLRPEHEANLSLPSAILAVDPTNTTAQGIILHRLADVTRATAPRAMELAGYLQSCRGSAAFAIPRLKEIAEQRNLSEEQRRHFRTAIAVISKASAKEDLNKLTRSNDH
jgi:hypothetical protein